MDTAFSTTTLLVGIITVLLGLVTFLMPPTFYKWLSRKKYQYEVTMSLYMLTPTEKFIFSGFPLLHPGAIRSHALPSPLPFPRRCREMRNAVLIRYATDSVLFLLISLLTIAAFLYLPDHLLTIARRAFYYYAGDESGSSAVAMTASSLSEPAVETLRSSGQQAREVLGVS
jgi:hypothetical protein